MKNITAPLFLAMFALLAGCAAPMQPTTWRIAQPFDADQARALLQPGPNTIKGNGFIRQRGGGVVTCAGSQVRLIPLTEYAKQRLTYLYGSGMYTGVALWRPGESVVFEPDPPAYAELTRITRCDGQGNFVFDRVADGEFFVSTVVTWVVASQPQGGSLITRVRVSGGVVESVVLSPN
jgi:hypothetical protein